MHFNTPLRILRANGRDCPYMLHYIIPARILSLSSGRFPCQYSYRLSANPENDTQQWTLHQNKTKTPPKHIQSTVIQIDYNKLGSISIQMPTDWDALIPQCCKQLMYFAVDKHYIWCFNILSFSIIISLSRQCLVAIHRIVVVRFAFGAA